MIFLLTVIAHCHVVSVYGFVFSVSNLLPSNDMRMRPSSSSPSPSVSFLRAVPSRFDEGYKGRDDGRKDEEQLLEEYKNKKIIDELMFYTSFSESPTVRSIIDNSNIGIAVKETYSSASSLLELNLLGQGMANIMTITPNDNKPKKKETSTLPSLFLSPPPYCQQLKKTNKITQHQQAGLSITQLQNIPSLPIPLPNKKIIQLLSFAYNAKPISKSLCLTINPLLINRDDALYDNLPWSTWTIDPLRSNRNVGDGKAIDGKFHLGKRDAYNRFLGKDWYGRSLSIGNLAARVKYFLEGDSIKDFQDYFFNFDTVSNDNDNDKKQDNVSSEDSITSFDDDAITNLAKRIMLLELNEASSDLAQVEQDLAIHLAQKKKKMPSENGVTPDTATTDITGDTTGATASTWTERNHELQLKLSCVKDKIDEIQGKFDELHKDDNNSEQDNTSWTDMSSWNEKIKSIFVKFLEKKKLSSFLENVIEDNQSDAPYRGAMGYKPVIDTEQEMLEDSVLPYTSPFDLMNEIINEQLNAKVIGCIIENTSLSTGTISLGGAVVLKRMGRKKTQTLFGETIELDDEDDDYGNDGLKKGQVTIVECDCDEAIGMALTCNLDVLVERAAWEKVQTNVYKDRDSASSSFGIPAVVTIGDSNIIKDNDTNNDDAATETTDEKPVKSLAEYDALANEDKGQILKSLDSFKGKLPRPRILRQYDSETKEQKKKKPTSNHPLDKLLIPLIDESVRGQILIREAVDEGDFDTAFRMRQAMSKRQISQSNAVQARLDGEDRLAGAYDEEADFYASLRADVTQDEGSYNKFLDKDEDYERARLARVKKLSKKDFGSLLDGIE